jgi:hypothetical protein
VHAHTCLDCGAVIATGDFDCEGDDTDHDFALCDTCAGADLTPADRNWIRQVADDLANPDTWCTDAFARDAAGNAVSHWDPAAVRWCAAGRLFRLAGDQRGQDIARVYAARFGSEIITDNDQYGREYVRDRLIALAQQLAGL